MEFSPEDGLVPEEGYKPWSCALHDNTAVFGPGFGGPNKCNFFPESVSSSSHPSCVQSYDPSLQPRYSLTGPVYEKNRQRFGLPLPPVNYNNRRPRQVMNSAYFGSPPQGMVPSLYFKQTSQVASAPNALVTTSPYGSYAPLGGTYGSFQSPFGHTTRHSAPQGMDPSFATTFPYRSYAPLATYGSYQPPPCEENHVLPKRNNRLGTKELSFYEANRSLFEMRNPQSLANNVSPAGVVPYSRPSTHVQPLANNVFPASVASYFRPSIPAQPMANNVYPAGVASYSRPSTPVQPLAYNVSPSCVASYSRLSTPAQPLANNVSPGGVVSYSRPSTPVQPLANIVSPSGAQTYSHPSTPALSGDYLGGLEEDLQRFYSTLPSLDFDDQRPHQVNSAFNESAPQGGIDSSPDFNQIFSVDGVSNAYNYSLNNSIESDVGFNPVVATFSYDNYNPHGAYDSYQSSVMDPHVRPSNGENETFLPPLPQSHDFSPYEVTPATGPTQAQTPTFGNVPENPQPGTGDHPQPQQGGYY